MKFSISVANNRKSKVWKNKDVTWEEFLEKVKNTIRTAETVEEYKELPKSQQDEIKDVGGFVGGKLREGKRRTGFVEYRSMLTLDMDYAELGIWERIKLLFNFICCIYSTHKHTSEKPRLRLIIPLASPVSPEEYVAISRQIAFEIGIEQFDDTTYQPHRLMYWPSTSTNGDFIFANEEGELLDPKIILARYDNWKDTSKWPVSSRQKVIVKRLVKRQSDPLDKTGIIGAFCRAYDIQLAVEKFISDVYEPSLMEGRYDYIPADSTAGVLIYDDKFVYSHHATDPACGKLCNAFDIVRIHKFGHLDADEDTIAPNLPSFKAMQEFCLNDAGVKRQLAEDRLAQISDDFTIENDGDWQLQLELNRNGTIKDTPSNIAVIIKNDLNLKGIAFNLQSKKIDVNGNLPWCHTNPGWSDDDLTDAMMYIDKYYKIWSPVKVTKAITSVARTRLFHPVKDYLESLPTWDGIERVDTLLIDYLGAEDTIYTRAVMRKTLCAAIARVYTPGIKYDHILVLNGQQGIGKSLFFSKLGGKWFSDSLTISDMRDKTAAEKLQDYWILELGELAGIKKMDVETVKSFVTRTDDKFRPAYGINVGNHPRQCIIVGSTNAESGFLRDTTGNRRFLPVKVTSDSQKKPWDINCVDQIWAEALARYHAGEGLMLEGEAARMALIKQSEAMESDDREGLIRIYLDKLLPENWKGMNLYERRNFLNDSDLMDGNTPGVYKRERVCTMEIWCECLGKDAADLRKQDSYELNAIMSRIKGWKKYDANKNGTLRFALYGTQRAHVRI